MTPTEINRRVALLCGWTPCGPLWKSSSGDVFRSHPWYTENHHAASEILKRVEAECGVKIQFMNTLEELFQSRCDGPCDVTPWDYLLVEPEMICKAFLIVKGEYEE